MATNAYINGKMLRYVRLKRRVSALRLATLLRVNRSTLRAWETEEKRPSFSTVEKIADILEFPLGVLWLSKAFDGRNRFPTRREDRKMAKERQAYLRGER